MFKHVTGWHWITKLQTFVGNNYCTTVYCNIISRMSASKVNVLLTAQCAICMQHPIRLLADFGLPVVRESNNCLVRSALCSAGVGVGLVTFSCIPGSWDNRWKSTKPSLHINASSVNPWSELSYQQRAEWGINTLEPRAEASCSWGRKTKPVDCRIPGKSSCSSQNILWGPHYCFAGGPLFYSPKTFAESFLRTQHTGSWSKETD